MLTDVYAEHGQLFEIKFEYVNRADLEVVLFKDVEDMKNAKLGDFPFKGGKILHSYNFYDRLICKFISCNDIAYGVKNCDVLSRSFINIGDKIIIYRHRNFLKCITRKFGRFRVITIQVRIIHRLSLDEQVTLTMNLCDPRGEGVLGIRGDTFFHFA